MLTCYPPTAPIRSTEPTLLQEPIAVAEAKYQCRIAEAISYHDAELAAIVVDARQQVEHDSGLICYTGTFTWKFTDFPDRDWFEIEVRPVTSVSSITYVDTSGTTQTLTASYYALDTASVVPLVRLTYGNVWPAVRSDINGITVTMVAGYATVVAVPMKVKQAVKLKAHEMFLRTKEASEEADKQALAYDRQIEFIRREVYA